jgi:hypothetical protein
VLLTRPKTAVGAGTSGTLQGILMRIAGLTRPSSRLSRSPGLPVGSVELRYLEPPQEGSGSNTGSAGGFLHVRWVSNAAIARQRFQ